MPDSSFIAVPGDIAENPIVLRRFLLTLIEQLDIAFGNRGTNPFATASAVDETTAEISKIITEASAITEAELADKLTADLADLLYVRQDGTNDSTAIQSYDSAKTFISDQQLISKKYADDSFTLNPQQTDPGDLSQTITGPTIIEVQNISDKIDAILALLRTANII